MVRLEVLILEIFILMSMENGTKSHGKNLISQNKFDRSIIVQAIRMLVLKNMVLNAEHR